MSETPEAIRERIHAEELAKGSDPRVAEARAKAAEMRARHGLPIDPQEAWRAKLAKEGGAPSESAPRPPDPIATEETTSTENESEQAPVAAETPPEPKPTTEPAPAAVPEPAAAVPEPSPPPEPEVPFDPEIGDVIVVDQSVSEIGGVRVRDARLPSWLMVILLAIPLWAILYLLALGGEDVARKTSECVVQPDRTFVCFQPAEEITTGGGGH